MSAKQLSVILLIAAVSLTLLILANSKKKIKEKDYKFCPESEQIELEKKVEL
jgi:hypothetical protein